MEDEPARDCRCVTVNEPGRYRVRRAVDRLEVVNGRGHAGEIKCRVQSRRIHEVHCRRGQVDNSALETHGRGWREAGAVDRRGGAAGVAALRVRDIGDRECQLLHQEIEGLSARGAFAAVQQDVVRPGLAAREHDLAARLTGGEGELIVSRARRHSLIRNVHLQFGPNGERSIEADRLAGRQVDAVIDVLAVGDRAACDLSQGDERNGDRQRGSRGHRVVASIRIGDERSAVGDDDHVVIARIQARQGDVRLSVVGVAGVQRAGMRDALDQDGGRIEDRTLRHVHGVDPVTHNGGRGGRVLNDVADVDRLPRHGRARYEDVR